MTLYRYTRNFRATVSNSRETTSSRFVVKIFLKKKKKKKHQMPLRSNNKSTYENARSPLNPKKPYKLETEEVDINGDIKISRE